MSNLIKSNDFTFKDELHARPYIKLGNNLRTFHFAYLIKENDEGKAWIYLDKFLKQLSLKS